MFYDENITRTKAFQEQLEQHGELFAAWSNSPSREGDRVNPRIRGVLNNVKDWLRSLVHADASFHPSKSS